MANLIHLVRHGETVGESSIRFHGRNDVALSDLGRAQVGALAQRLQDRHYDAVACSPLIRAAESADILMAARAQPVPERAQIDGLAEVFFGELEGMTAEEIEAAFPVWHADRRAHIPGRTWRRFLGLFWSQICNGRRPARICPLPASRTPRGS